MATVSTTIELVDKITSQLNNIKGAVDEVQGALDDINGSQSNLDSFSWKTFLDNAEKAGKKMEQIGKTMTVAITTPLVLLGKKMYGNAVDYESAYVGMTKTVEGTEEQDAALVETAKELSETTPMGYTDLMGIAQTGGNLGVAIDNMETFMRSYAQLQYATDQHISGESGAQDVASFLNITEGGVQNIDRFGSSLVHLGNNFNATEDQIISMGNRMASAGHLAGLATPEILGMATAFTAVGIRAEAGGSAASKLIKQFQLSAEVGGQAQRTLDAIGQHFDSGLEFSNYLAGLKKDELVGIADQLNMTTEAVQSMADSWLLMDQFAEVSGKTAQQFVDDWSKDPARAMGDFFTGLSKLGDDGADSILSTLDRMGLTEIRESNLIAAMASRPELFISAIQAAVEAYGSNTAMMEEFNKQMETQESQNAMLSNKMDNTMANFGDNLVQALQPALDLLNNMLDAFNQLSEVDQTHIIEALGALAIGGPALTALGKTVELVSKLAQGLTKINELGGVEAAVNGAAGAAGAGNAAGVAGAAAGGSALAGVAGVGVIAAASAWAIHERQTNENIRGSVNAINKATEGNADLQQAFVDYVTANQQLEDYLISPDFTDEGSIPYIEAANQANQAFQAFEQYAQVMDAYSAWRQENSLGNMDFQMPEGLPELFSQSGADAGQNLPAGVGEGITGNESAATSAATTMGTDTIDAANAGLGVNSPSICMIQSGMDVANGLAQGITSGGSAAIAAISAVSNQTISIARSILSASAGAAIGRNVAMGIANGIRSGQGAVAAAARALAQSAMSALRSSMQIHSPSRVTYNMGEYTVQGFVEGILDRRKTAGKAVESVVSSANKAWNTAAWSDIALFAGLEHDQLLDDAIKISDSDIRNIRDLAEREVINHFTTAQVRVEMTNNNSINSEMDLDGIVSYLGDAVSERLEAVAEGVYS